MSDLLEEAKKEVDRWYGPGNYEMPGDIVQRLIAEVERLRSDLVICDEVDDEDQVIFNHYEKLIAEVESLTEAKDELKRLEEERDKRIDKWAEIVENLEAKNAELKYGWKNAQEWRESNYKLAQDRSIEIYNLKQQLAASEKGRDDFQSTAECSSQINQELEDEIKSVVTEINSIKAERNAVIKAHADLLGECQELKTQLKFLEARLEK